MFQIIIIGSGAVARQTLSLIYMINSVKMEYEVIGFLDDFADSMEMRTVPYLGKIADFVNYKCCSFVIAIADPRIREKVYGDLEYLSCRLPNLLHPNIVLDPFCNIDWNKIKGNIINANTIIGCDVILGNNNLINYGCILAHNTKIGNHNTIMHNTVAQANFEIINRRYLPINSIISGSNAIKGEID